MITIPAQWALRGRKPSVQHITGTPQTPVGRKGLCWALQAVGGQDSQPGPTSPGSGLVITLGHLPSFPGSDDSAHAHHLKGRECRVTVPGCLPSSTRNHWKPSTRFALSTDLECVLFWEGKHCPLYPHETRSFGLTYRFSKMMVVVCAHPREPSSHPLF